MGGTITQNDLELSGKVPSISYFQNQHPLTQPGLGQLGYFPQQLPQTVIGGIPDVTWKRLSNETRLAILKELGVIS